MISSHSLNKKNNLFLINLLAILSGVILSLPFFSGSLWIFAWFGFVPLFFTWENQTISRRIYSSFISGVVFFSCSIYWLIHVTLAGQIVLILYLSLYFLLFGIIVNIRKDNHSASSLFFIPACWVVLEFIRSILFTGFGWASLGYSQYQFIPMIQIADIGGVYAVSFILMMVNYGIYLILKKDIKKSIKYSTTIICFCLLITCFSYGVFKINNKSFEKEIKIAVIQGNIPQDVKWREGSSPYILKEYLHLTKQAAEDNPQLIVWPESSFPEVLDRESYVFDSIVDVARQIKIPLLVGAITAEGNELYNSALLVSSDGEIVKKYNKLHLVPFGEYLPFKRLFSFVEHIAPAPIGDCASGKTYSVFSSESNNEKFSVLICFEDVFSNVARTFANGGAEFLAVITNDAWFKETTAPYQHVQASVFRAVENRIPIIRAANTGVSCFIDSSGKITSRVTDASSEKDIFISGYSSDIVRIPGGGSTFYMRYSDLFIVICCMFILISLFIEKKKQN